MVVKDKKIQLTYIHAVGERMKSLEYMAGIYLTLNNNMSFVLLNHCPLFVHQQHLPISNTADLKLLFTLIVYIPTYQAGSLISS